MDANSHFGEQLKNHYMDFIQRVKQDHSLVPAHRVVFLIHNPHFEGFTDEQIEEIRKAQKVNVLPKIYQQVLQVLGKDHAGIFMGMEATFAELKYRKEDMQISLGYKRLEERPTPELPENAFVFFSLAGSRYVFFETQSEEDDPPVFFYSSGAPMFEKVADKLSTWFLEHGILGKDVLLKYGGGIFGDLKWI